jgi:hypothetical protein
LSSPTNGALTALSIPFQSSVDVYSTYPIGNAMNTRNRRIVGKHIRYAAPWRAQSDLPLLPA